MSHRPQVVLLHGRYRLLSALGQGGMGSVSLAEDLLLDREVALKELVKRDGGGDVTERRIRAVREARAMARVRHPAIVRIHDLFFVPEQRDAPSHRPAPRRDHRDPWLSAEDRDPWIVMEYIDGRQLSALIGDRQLAEPEIAKIGLAGLSGLRAVHRARVVHRDVKPANILVAKDGSVFLVDIG